MTISTNRALIPLLVLVTALWGCAAPAARNRGAADPPPAVQFDPALARQIMAAAQTVPGVQDAAAVATNRDVLAAVTVTGFDRLHLKAIRRDVGRKIAGVRTGRRVAVTTDKKIFAELRQIEGEIEGGPPPADVGQRLAKIRNDMNG